MDGLKVRVGSRVGLDEKFPEQVLVDDLSDGCLYQLHGDRTVYVKMNGVVLAIADIGFQNKGHAGLMVRKVLLPTAPPA